ncbi:MAG: group 1 truncated hemoglobin [Caldimonas sp.]
MTASSRFIARIALAASCCLAVVPTGWADGAEVAARGPADSALYEALGGQPSLVALVDDLTRRLVADPRTGSMFDDVDLVHFKAELVAQLCEVSGGPCVYRGKDMKTAHAGIDVTKAHFNALVELMQQAMDAQGIAFRVQNRLLARLAPMHREVVNATPGAGPAPTAH